MKLMSVDGMNNGGSYIKELQDQSADAIETVLLSDIFNEALAQSQPKSVVIKADIETYECRAFLNSQQGNSFFLCTMEGMSDAKS